MCVLLYVLNQYEIVDFSWTLSSVAKWMARSASENSEKRRTYYHSRNQLNLTKTIKIQPKELCNPLVPIAVFIHSTADDFKRRQTMRNTWLSDVKRHNISAYFAIGLSANQTIDDLLLIESHLYSDLIQFGFVDNYYNNTLKAVSILRWIDTYCTSPPFILKTDDDVVVNISAVIDHLDELRPGFTGTLFDNAVPVRKDWGKWYMPHQYYPQSRYPPYMNGPAYVMTNNITKHLITDIDKYTGYVLDIDDVFVTGIVAERIGIQRYATELIKYHPCYDVCVMSSTAITYECETDEELTLFWLKMHSTSLEYCRRLDIWQSFFKAMLIPMSLMCLYIGIKYYRRNYTKEEYVCVQQSIKSL